MNNHDLDLSHLLVDSEVPSDGVARVRATVTKRRRRRQIGASVLSGIVMIAVGTGVSYATLSGGDDEVVISREASDVAVTTTTSTTSTTIAEDPRGKYVGLEHTRSGSGLPVDVELFSGAVLSTDGVASKGAKMMFHMRDDIGDMLWLEEVVVGERGTGSDEQYVPARTKVLAVFDQARLQRDEYFCIGYCGLNNKIDVGVVGLVKGEKVVKAWRVDVPGNGLDSISATGVTAFVDWVQEIELPARPELYYFAVTATEEQAWAITSRQDVLLTGAYEQVSFFRDGRENKTVAVFKEGDKRAMVSVEGVAGGFTNFYKYRGEVRGDVFVYVEGDRLVGAWVFDKEASSFSPVDVNEISAP